MTASSLRSLSLEPDTGGYLRDVDHLLDEVLGELDLVWSTTMPHAQLDVLAQTPPEMLRTLIHGSGKRIRPTMVHLGWSVTQAEAGRDTAVRLGAALELLHVFALIHDDVMDESRTRRGAPTVHAQAERDHQRSQGRGRGGRFGESVAVLVGDLAHTEADHLASGFGSELRGIWRELSVELFGGQLLDLIGTANGHPDVETARTVARMKSGAYTVTRPLQLGAVAGRASLPVRTALHRYGQEVGAAFALRDDYLGVWGSIDRTGKPAGDDLLAGKPTMILVLAGQARMSAAGAAALERVGTSALTPADVTLLQSELRECGVAGTVDDLIDAHLQAAHRALDPRLFPASGVSALMSAAQRVAWRDR